MNLDIKMITPIQRINYSLNNNKFYMKREDLYPISFGGNKARKAILFFDYILKNNYNCIVTYGSSSSNHCRIISNIAASLKLPCYIISPNENFKMTFNYKMIQIFNSKVINCSVNEVKDVIKNTIEELLLKGLKPYFIPGGGHGDIGTKAYVNVYDEIYSFEEKNNIKFDYVFHASGTGTTQAGLVVGKLLKGDDKEIVGISIARKNPYGKQVVLDSVNSYLNNLNKNFITKKEIVFTDDYVLDGYGFYNNDILDTIKQVLISDGVPLDSTYTGKAFWGMKKYISKNNIVNKNILFIHTGGTPLFFDGMEEQNFV